MAGRSRQQSGRAPFIRDNGYTNVILEIANEYNINGFKDHPLVHEPEGMVSLIDLAREQSGGLLVGSSGGGGMADEAVVKASDIVLIHGNGQSAGHYYDFVSRVKSWAPDRPIVCNEDSPCCTRVDVALDTGTSWGYYNNYTKQIPPADYGVTPGEDLFLPGRRPRRVTSCCRGWNRSRRHSIWPRPPVTTNLLLARSEATGHELWKAVVPQVKARQDKGVNNVVVLERNLVAVSLRIANARQAPLSASVIAAHVPSTKTEKGRICLAVVS